MRFVKENIGVQSLYQDAGKQIRMNRDRTRLLFRKSDKVVLEFKCDEPEITPSRGIRLESGNIADFCYSNDSKYVYIITDDGVLHFRSKNLDKDYVIDRSRFGLRKKASTTVWFCPSVESTWPAALTSARTR